MARDRLSIDTFTAGIERETVYSKATNVAAILRSLGTSTSDREQGVAALCSYIEGKRSKGKNDEEIRKKIGTLQNMVPADLGHVFVKASLRSGLARKTTAARNSIGTAPSPTPSSHHPHRARISLADPSNSTTITHGVTASASSAPSNPNQPTINDVFSTPQTDDSDLEPPSPTFTFSFSPSFSPTSSISSPMSTEDLPAETSTSSSASASTSFSSFSSPPPLSSSTSTYASPYTPG
ncbi:uncharacterized protein I303_102088 [Kwoniella dejecticola CBS 10117]|uniref:Uncharacterized protein n=1 Tax=Kwoniella dejecticola CBS 10117 TaxID=1296121 RepID=A0A1A6ABZ6_9TREE|nr:uncharacterized protein I303_01771 [Kwoniella dejecticola CBS 10117]OBR87563.1 hypothetical protein I303_01771 [Kwoniella dejecticola CBS 10117]